MQHFCNWYVPWSNKLNFYFGGIIAGIITAAMPSVSFDIGSYSQIRKLHLLVSSSIFLSRDEGSQKKGPHHPPFVFGETLDCCLGQEGEKQGVVCWGGGRGRKRELRFSFCLRFKLEFEGRRIFQITNWHSAYIFYEDRLFSRWIGKKAAKNCVLCVYV